MKKRAKIKETVYAFIDSQNLNLAIRDQDWKLDFAKFLVYLKDKYQVQRTYLFIGYIADNEDLYCYLRQAGYRLIFKPILKYNKSRQSFIKGNVDAELVLHSMIQYPNYDKAIIVSGDGDFYCLVEYLLEKKKLAYVIVPNFFKFSALLRKFMRNIVFLNKLKNKLQKQNERH